MPLRTLGALALATTLGLSACSGDDPEPTFAPSPSASATSAVASPSAPSDGEPTRPALARQFSATGADALVTYFWQLADYAQATGDVRPLKKVSAAECAPCTSGRKAISAVYDDGGQIEGGETTVNILETKRVRLREGPAFQVLARVKNQAQRIDLPGDSKDGEFPSSTIRATFVVINENGVPIISYWNAQ
ncbi:DUF6318 family protein [Nocardioides sp. SOB77]|uniref:DUF6318 family protein n=1 Tax=Nocardioides oceani TaxID=3058369 RepID=A0ABT8FJ52_9ACTN|nr:DUF6318 family protein [Nocardioides oceani]MDN4174422.1 DUF6318 family protein [Nocardioides oceani]